MTKRDMATLACRAMAVWLFVQAVLAGTSVVATLVMVCFEGLPNWSVPLLALIPMAGILGAGALLWVLSPRLGVWIGGEDAENVELVKISSQSAMTIVLAAAGVYVFAVNLHDLVAALVRPVASNLPMFQWWNNDHWQANLWGAVVGEVIGLWLIFGSRGLTRLIQWARQAGMRNGVKVEGHDAAH